MEGKGTRVTMLNTIYQRTVDFFNALLVSMFVLAVHIGSIFVVGFALAFSYFIYLAIEDFYF